MSPWGDVEDHGASQPNRYVLGKGEGLLLFFKMEWDHSSRFKQVFAVEESGLRNGLGMNKQDTHAKSRLDWTSQTCQ